MLINHKALTYAIRTYINDHDLAEFASDDFRLSTLVHPFDDDAHVVTYALFERHDTPNRRLQVLTFVAKPSHIMYHRSHHRHPEATSYTVTEATA